MRKKILALAALPLALAFLGGCGGSGHTTPPPSAECSCSGINIGYNASSDRSVAGGSKFGFFASLSHWSLSFDVVRSGTGACPVGQALLPAGATVQFSDLSNPTQLDTLSNTTVTANTYTALQLTFGSPLSATVSVDPGANFTDGTNSCDNTNAWHTTDHLSDFTGSEHYDGNSHVPEPNRTHRRDSRIVYRLVWT